MVRPDLLEPAERAARVVEAEHHPVVDVLGRADALGHGEARLVDELAHDPAEHEPGRVLDPRDVAAEAREEGLRALGGDGRRRRAARHLDEPRVTERREGVEADRAAGRVERAQRPFGAEDGERAALERGLVLLGAAVDREPRHVALGAERLDRGVARARRQAAQLLGDRQVAGDDDEPPVRRPRPRAGPGRPGGAGRPRRRTSRARSCARGARRRRASPRAGSGASAARRS